MKRYTALTLPSIRVQYAAQQPAQARARSAYLFLLRNNHDFLSRSYEYHYLGYDSYMPTLWHFVSKYEADVSKSLIIQFSSWTSCWSCCWRTNSRTSSCTSRTRSWSHPWTRSRTSCWGYSRTRSGTSCRRTSSRWVTSRTRKTSYRIRWTQSRTRTNPWSCRTDRGTDWRTDRTNSRNRSYPRINCKYEKIARSLELRPILRVNHHPRARLRKSQLRLI